MVHACWKAESSAGAWRCLATVLGLVGYGAEGYVGYGAEHREAPLASGSPNSGQEKGSSRCRAQLTPSLDWSDRNTQIGKVTRRFVTCLISNMVLLLSWLYIAIYLKRVMRMITAADDVLFRLSASRFQLQQRLHQPRTLLQCWHQRRVIVFFVNLFLQLWSFCWVYFVYVTVSVWYFFAIFLAAAAVTLTVCWIWNTVIFQALFGQSRFLLFLR